jgi:hypothetical protein
MTLFRVVGWAVRVSTALGGAVCQLRGVQRLSRDASNSPSQSCQCRAGVRLYGLFITRWRVRAASAICCSWLRGSTPGHGPSGRPKAARGDWSIHPRPTGVNPFCPRDAPHGGARSRPPVGLRSIARRRHGHGPVSVEEILGFGIDGANPVDLRPRAQSANSETVAISGGS